MIRPKVSLIRSAVCDDVKLQGVAAGDAFEATSGLILSFSEPPDLFVPEELPSLLQDQVK